SLRMYTPVGQLDRITGRSYQLPNTDIVIDKGTKMFIPTYALHHDPEIYPNPYLGEKRHHTSLGKSSTNLKTNFQHAQSVEKIVLNNINYRVDQCKKNLNYDPSIKTPCKDASQLSEDILATRKKYPFLVSSTSSLDKENVVPDEKFKGPMQSKSVFSVKSASDQVDAPQYAIYDQPQYSSAVPLMHEPKPVPLMHEPKLSFQVRDFNNSKKSDNYPSRYNRQRCFAVIPVLVLADSEIIKHVLIKDFDVFTDRGFFEANETDEPIMRNLFGLTGDEWRKMRNKMSPTFTSGKIKEMFPLMESCGRNVVSILTKYINKKNESIDVKEYLGRYMTDLIGSTVFGMEINALENPDCEFRKVSKEMLNPKLRFRIVMILVLLIPNIRKFLSGLMMDRKNVQFFLDLVHQNLSYREQNNIKRNDFINIMMELRKNDPDITEELITAQCFLFFIAGFDTSSTVLTFSLYELAKNKSIQSTLRKEINDTKAKYGGELTYESYDEMPLDIYMEIKFGLKSPFAGIFTTTTPVLVLADSEIIKHVLIKDFDVFTDRGFFETNETDEPIIRNLLVAEQDITEELITAQCFVFFIAGFDTSSTVLTFSLYELAKNKSIQSTLRKEINDTKAKYGGELTYESYDEMPLLDRVIKESLRMYTPLGQLDRITGRSYQLPNTDIVIDKGTKMFIPLYGLHHDPEIYPTLEIQGTKMFIPTYALHHDPEIYPNPYVFDPERFAPENAGNIPNYAYLPFGEGPRNCIGKRFAQLQLKSGLACLVSNFEWNPDHTNVLRFLKGDLGLRPVKPITLKVKSLSY
ncbi:cytochrome P450 6a22-like, partial [Diaphorina citri]|uniref:Cytochrome P450 6a22-like n=1 Tax=Diaphorina citri TaxID=121845 RepID=A0A3Q0JC49_DIACI